MTYVRKRLITKRLTVCRKKKKCVQRMFHVSLGWLFCVSANHYKMITKDLSGKVTAGEDDAAWVTWKMALMIAMPICAICVVVMVIYHVRKTPERPGNSDDSQEAPDRPILGSVTIRGMLEMTTSGSGSGRSN